MPICSSSPSSSYLGRTSIITQNTQTRNPHCSHCNTTTFCLSLSPLPPLLSLHNPTSSKGHKNKKKKENQNCRNSSRAHTRDTKREEKQLHALQSKTLNAQHSETTNGACAHHDRKRYNRKHQLSHQTQLRKRADVPVTGIEPGTASFVSIKAPAVWPKDTHRGKKNKWLQSGIRPGGGKPKEPWGGGVPKSGGMYAPIITGGRPIEALGEPQSKAHFGKGPSNDRGGAWREISFR